MTKSEAIALAAKYQSLPTYKPLVLPVPTSKNNLHTHGKGRGYHTHSYQVFRKAARLDFLEWHLEYPNFDPFIGQRGKLVLTFRWQLFTDNHRGDLMNHSQALLDSLNTFAWVDDAYINLHLDIPDDPKKMIDKENPRAVIWLNPVRVAYPR